MQYSDHRQAIADASGKATIRWEWAFSGHGSRLNVNRIGVRSSSATAPEARIYLSDVPMDANFVAGTFTGHNDTAVFPPGHLSLQPFFPLLVVWSGCDPGSICTMTIEGNIE